MANSLEQLLAAGALANKINISSECTHCLKDKYFSYRRDQVYGPETMLAYIGIKSN